MALWQNIKEYFRPKPEEVVRKIDFDTLLAAGISLEKTLAGIPITPESQMEVSSFWAGCTHIGNTIASLPKKIMKRQADGGWLHEEDHSLQDVIACEPNPAMTAASYWKWFVIQRRIYGNAFTKIVWKRNKVAELRPIPSVYMLV